MECKPDTQAQILSSVDQGILTITLNRPEKKNAITYAMYDRLCQVLADSAVNSDVRVVVLTANGDYFTAGNDLGAFQSGADLKYYEKPAFRFMNTLASFPKPVIAAVNGHAIGIGVTMLLHCDLVYAGIDCQFKLPFLNLGLVPEFGSTVLLPQMMGHAKAAELLFLGEKFDATRAAEFGLVNKALPLTAVLTHARNAANSIALKPVDAVLSTKALMKKLPPVTIAEIIDDEAREFSQRLRSPETQEIIAAYRKT